MSKENGINPAAAAALARGDIGNALVAMTPGGIEAQEAAGQQLLVHGDFLPINGLPPSLSVDHGFKIGEPIDDLFVRVTLPDGWHKRPTEHSMWSELVDDNGKVRAKIFYKAAFYDRHARFEWIWDGATG